MEEYSLGVVHHLNKKYITHFGARLCLHAQVIEGRHMHNREIQQKMKTKKMMMK
jgi:hypothetical protein